MNDIPATTKLEWALQMAESMALMHNHPRGIIVHDDVQPFQWLIAEDGHIKMNGEHFIYSCFACGYCAKGSCGFYLPLLPHRLTQRPLVVRFFLGTFFLLLLSPSSHHTGVDFNRAEVSNATAIQRE